MHSHRISGLRRGGGARRRVPKYWLAQWLNLRFPDALPEDKLDSIDGADRDNIRRIFGLVTMVMPYDSIPRPLLDKQLMGKVLRMRADQIEFPISKFCSQALRSDFSIDWTQSFPYAFEWAADGLVTKCKSFLGEEHTMDRHAVITESFVLSYSYDPPAGGGGQGRQQHFARRLVRRRLEVEAPHLGQESDPAEHDRRGRQRRVGRAERGDHPGKVDESRVVLQNIALKESRKRAAEAARLKQQANTKKRRCQVNLQAINTSTT